MNLSFGNIHLLLSYIIDGYIELSTHGFSVLFSNLSLTLFQSLITTQLFLNVLTNSSTALFTSNREVIIEHFFKITHFRPPSFLL